ncbi:MAG: acyl-CoA dehydrogenase family protein [Acidobacteria bacterium]|nr:acyl-CoA dehydrogenase family protein [Acidobacteriota bacterium]
MSAPSPSTPIGTASGAMDFRLTADQKGVRDSIRELADKVLRPRAAAFEAAGEVPADVRRHLAEMGLFGMLVPERFGGSALDPLSYCLAIEELARACAATSITVSVSNSVVAAPIAAHGSDEQKQSLLPSMARGELLGAFCLTEAHAGSDAAALRTRATRTAEGYRLQGSKAWATNAGWAGLFIIFATLDPALGSRGITAFLVRSGNPGQPAGPPERKMGLRASSTAPVYLDDCEIPSSDRLGEEGRGMAIALETLDAARIGVAAQCVGIAQAAFEEATAYARGRRAFGHPIAEFGAVKAQIADMATDIDAARLLTHHAASLRATGAEFGCQASMAKLWASEAANRVAARAVQIHGAAGYSADSPVERLYRDARVTTIYEGTSEIQRLVIARRLLGSRVHSTPISPGPLA